MASSQRSSKKKTSPEKLQKENFQEVNLGKIVRDERSHKILGAFMLLMAFFIFVALTSYLFTWQQDQDEVRYRGWTILMPNKLKITNTLGSFGAFISHNLVWDGFGVASFLFCNLFFVIGVNLLFGRKVFSLLKHVIYLIIGLILFSISFSFVMRGSDFQWGGELGNVMNEWLNAFIGYFGTAMLLIVSLVSYLIWRFNPVINTPKLPAFHKKVKPAEADLPPDPEEDLTDDEEDATSVTLKKKPGNGLKAANRKATLLPFHDEEDDMDPGFTLIEKPLLPTPDGTPLSPSTESRAGHTPPPPLRPDIRQVEEVSGGLALEIKPTVPEVITEEEPLPVSAIVNLPPYDPVLDLRDYKYPSLDLLEMYPGEKIVMDPTELEANKNQILKTLENYDIAIQKIFATVGPTVTLYEIVPAAGVRISRIKNLEDDIALSLSALGIRIIAPIPGKGTIGIEVPNVKKSMVGMRGLLSSEKFQNNTFALPIALGKKIDNEHFIVDLATMPHLLMAGATGQGKSVGINALIVSLLYKKHPSQLKFVLVDPKKVELSLYKTIEKHFLAKLPGEEDAIITDTKKVINTLNALCIEMDTRYDLLKEASCRNIREYNEKFVARKLNPEKGHQFLPFIVLVIDEFADLIMTAGKEIEMPIARLAQLARAVGIHLIIATQRPSVNIITGTIKANFPARVAFKVSSKIDSRTILDTGGAEQLIGRGDMLVSYNGEVTRLQCVFVDTPEVERVVESIGKQRGYPQAFLLPEYIDEKDLESRDFDLLNRDPLFEDAARLIVQTQMGSTSLIQRRMKLGYNRAGRLMDQLEAAGIVGPSQGSKVREVLYKTETELEDYLQSLI
jgi:S-DNA-T family DNA segregation ATPase FtsK/SpoIIIE